MRRDALDQQQLFEAVGRPVFGAVGRIQARIIVRFRAVGSGFVIRIEPEAFVAEQTAEIKKISRATPKVQNVERGRSIQPEVLDAFYVNANPVVRVLIGVDLSRVRPMRIMFA